MYLGDRERACGGCGAVVVLSATFRCVKLGKYSELLYGRRFSLRLKMAVLGVMYDMHFLYGSEAWCLTQAEIGSL